MLMNINRISEEKTAYGAKKRTLLKNVNSETGGLEVTHYVLSKGCKVEYASRNSEYQHYVIQGCAAKNDENGDLLHQDSAWFVPCTAGSRENKTRRHAICHAGEGEVRILTISYDVGDSIQRWPRSRSKNVNEVNQPHSANRVLSDVKIFKEEEYIAMGSKRTHRLSQQTVTGGVNIPEHSNLEQVLYVLMGVGLLYDDCENQEIGPGSMIYTPEGKVCRIKSVENLQYIVVEFLEKS